MSVINTRSSVYLICGNKLIAFGDKFVVFSLPMWFNQLIIVHIIIWALYFGGTGYYIDTYWYGLAEDKQMYFIHWSASRFFDVLFAYIVAELILQKFLLKGKYLMFATILLLFSFFHFVYDTWVWNWFNWEYLFVGLDLEQRHWIYGHIVQMIIIAFIFFASRNWSASYFKKKKLEDEVAQTELKFLKSQMSPHFLFNVFNNIYSLSLDENLNTHKAIAQLKSIMNYIQIFEEKEEITLAEEERYLQNYISLNRLRHNAKVRLKSNFEQSDLKIEPMLFLPFFENAFKHGKTGENDEIRAYFREKDGIITFEITNEINPNKRKDSVSGVGLENIKKRLPYLYRDFFMDTIQFDEKYKVKIRLDLGQKIKL